MCIWIRNRIAITPNDVRQSCLGDDMPDMHMPDISADDGKGNGHSMSNNSTLRVEIPKIPKIPK